MHATSAHRNDNIVHRATKVAIRAPSRLFGDVAAPATAAFI